MQDPKMGWAQWFSLFYFSYSNIYGNGKMGQ